MAAAADEAGLRFAHLSPDTPAVDVAVAPLPPGSGPLTDPGDDLASGLGYGTVSPATALPPGSYAVSVRAAGSDRSTPPVLSTRVELAAGAARTVTLTGMFADAALATVPDDLSAPPPGSARVRVLSAAAGPVDVGVVGGDAPAERLAPGDVGAAGTVPAGTLTLAVGAAEVPVTVAAGTVVTLLVLDRPGGGLEVRTVLDAAGPGVVPTGAVEAGSGPGLVPAAGAVLAGLVVARRRARVLLTVAGLTATALLTAPGPASAEGAVTSPHAAALPAAPVRLVVPSVGVNAPLTGVGLDPSGAFAPPADPAVAGWYTGGPAPGAIGPAAIAGHVDWAGAPGVFAALARVEPGAAVVVARADGGTARFTVTRVVRTPKTSFPTAEVYAPVEGAELRLITCGGAFDRARGSYEDNVVVFAEGASS